MKIRPVTFVCFGIVNVLSSIAIAALSQNLSLALVITIGAILTVGLNLALLYVGIQRPYEQELSQIAVTHQLDHSDSARALMQAKDLQMTNVGQEIGNRASELAINSAQVAFFVEQLATDIENTGDEASRVAAATEELAASTKEINHNATITAQSAIDAQQASESNKAQLQSNIDSITTLHSGVANATTQIHKLVERASEIQSITDVIDSIAEQTNLLALNAAIEAARAGEQGRGFAVVADEVRALASKTADATDKIGQMLKDMTHQTQSTTQVMDEVSNQTSQVVEVSHSLSESMERISQLMEDSSHSIGQISSALKEQDATTEELSSSILKISEFLSHKGKETSDVSNDATELSKSTESIFIQLSAFKTGTTIETMCQQAQFAAHTIGNMFEDAIDQNQISRQDLFDRNYQEIANTNPPKYSTAFDSFTDEHLPEIQEPLLNEFKDMIYAGAVDNNGYFPTHNAKFSKPLTGNYDKDVVNNRTKRLFNDPTGIRCGAHTEKFLLQTYKRDTGEIMHDVSAPIFVKGKHWGGFRIGFTANS